MSLDFLHPLRLLAFPVCAAAVILFCRFRRSRSRKERISHLLRYVLLLLVSLALAGTGILTASPDRTAYLLLDLSASVDEEETLRLANEALLLSSPPISSNVGVIAFGADATVLRSPGQQTPLSEADLRLDRGASDLSGALQLASALLPEDVNGGIAVISDGVISGDQNLLSAADGLPVNVLKTAPRGGPDAQVTSVSVPSSLYAGQKYTTLVSVHSDTAGPATLLLSRDRGEPETRSVTLRRGENTFAFDAVAAGAGVSTVEARILLPSDAVSANDAAAACVVVAGVPSVLLVEGQSGAGENLARMLEAAGMDVRTLPAAMLPSAPASFLSVHAVALVNVDAAQLSDEQTSALSSAVRDMGVGLAVFGGDSSFALGGYRGSALEDILPVTVDVRNRLDLPTTALLLVIDKSGSMLEGEYGVTRLSLAREAACRALEVLSDRDQAGVIAFDDAAKWVVPLSPVSDVEAMQQAIATIRSGGGTAFYSPLQMAFTALQSANAVYRHVIFLTDGEAGDTGYLDLVRRMANQGITVTTVAVGDGADYAVLSEMAEAGHGRMYAAGPFDSLPRIFTKETLLVSGAYVQSRSFVPLVSDASMTDFPSFPVLDGYLATTEKPLATVSLVSDRQDPILAWWQCGAGRVAAWMSDVQGGWTSSFLSWSRAAEFFGGMLSFVLPDRSAAGELSLSEDRLSWDVSSLAGEDAAAEADAWLSAAASASADLLRPDGSRETLLLSRVSASRFEAPADLSLPGAYAVRLSLLDAAGDVLKTVESGAVVGWTAEYDRRREDTGALERLAAESGGAVLSDPAGLFSFPDTAARRRSDLSPLLLALALLLFVFDVAQRRLDLFREKPHPAAPSGASEAPSPAGDSASPSPGPGKTAPSSAGAKKSPSSAPPPAAADVLWQSMKNKKKL